MRQRLLFAARFSPIYPELKKLLGSLAQRISERQMREMNHQVENGGKSAEKVAWEFLVSLMLLDPGHSSRVGPGGTITIGAKSFTESEILAELMATLIEGKSNIKVRRKFNLGTTATVFNRIRGGEIDLYAEYTGTGMSILGSLNPRELQDPDVAFAMVRLEFARRYDLVWLERFGFNNSWTLIMRRSDARDLGLKTISDLAGLLKEQSELEIPSLPAQIHFTMEQVKTVAAPEQILRDLKERLQPALEGGRMGKTSEERLRAQIDLVSLHIKLGNALKNFNGRLFKIVEVAKKTGVHELTKGTAKSLLSKLVEDKRVASRARKIAEPFRVKIGETARALIEQIQYLEKNAGTILPQDTFQWRTDFKDLLKRAEVLAVSSWDTALKESHKQVELLENLEKLGANPGLLKSLRDEGMHMRKEIINLKHYFNIAGMQREQLRRQISLATDQEEVTEACLKLGSGQVAPVKSWDFEDFRLAAKVHCEGKRAVVLGRGVELMEALLARKRGKKNDLEWDLDFEHRQLEELKKVKGADKKIKAAGKRVEVLQSALDSIQKELAALEGLVKKVQLKMRWARLQAEPLHNVAFVVETGLDVVKPGARSRIPSTWMLGSLLALMALGAVLGVRNRVWEKKWLWTSKGSKSPPEGEEEGELQKKKGDRKLPG